MAERPTLTMSARGSPRTLIIKEGAVLFRQGDASDRMLRVRTGEIEVLREVGGRTVLLRHVRGGEWLGELGVIENRKRSATARAAGDGEVEILTAQQFLERVSSDPALARDLILRLSVRLRKIEDRIAGDLLPVAHDWSRNSAATSDAVAAIGTTISLAAQTDTLRARIGAAPIQVERLPFLVGRVRVEGETQPSHRPDLPIEDEPPFLLSRQHFMIAQSGGRLLVTDSGARWGRS